MSLALPEVLAIDGGNSKTDVALVAADGSLLANPLIGQYELAGKLADRLIAENRQYLPWAGGAAPTPVVAGQPGR